ncbi:helix-turn-helix domain-containing protein [Rhodocista pekingensis]|uniref:Helix-turn-helix domain-containing protein n=1 Tax=Rhodocista pekingensis TaxID=201185 RepID=A0ABW2KUJ5_9PROT
MTTEPEDLPLSPATLADLRHPPLARRARLRAGLGQQAFAETYGIPLGTLRDWEQGRSAPDTAAASYLRAIANDPPAVAAAYAKATAA